MNSTSVPVETKFLKFGKYLVPAELNFSRRKCQVAPTSVMTFRELKQAYPDKVDLLEVPACDSFEKSVYPTIFEGEVSNRPIAPFYDPPVTIAKVQDGSCVGRQCCLVGPGNTQVRETGFNFDGDQLQSELFLGARHPYFRRYRMQGDLRQRRRLPARTNVSGSVAVLNNRAAHNYYHWFLEVAPRVAALEIAGITTDYYLIDCQNDYQVQILERMGIPRGRLIQPHCNLNLSCDVFVHVTHPGVSSIRRMADRLVESINVDEGRRRKLYVSRRNARNRKVSNESAITSFLKSRGFETVCFEELSIIDQIRMTREASTIVAPHGAGLTNSLFAKPSTTIVELFPKRRVNIDLYPSVSATRDLRHRTVLCRETGIRHNLNVSLRCVGLGLEI